jgi:hypothetical protein
MRQGTRGREEAARLQVETTMATATATMTMTRMTKALATKLTELLAV